MLVSGGSCGNRNDDNPGPCDDKHLQCPYCVPGAAFSHLIERTWHIFYLKAALG